MIVMFLWLMVVLALVLALTASRGARQLPPGSSPSTDHELARLREEVDRLSGQVERLLEEQSFIVELLGREERAALPGADPEEGKTLPPGRSEERRA